VVSSLGGRIAGRARRFGPLAWSAFMEAALYDDEGGFYQSGGAAGRGGDFVTSPELGPLFAAVVARALDGWWEQLERPDPFVVVEAAAGAGTLASQVLAAEPACARAIRYVLVERSAALRRLQAARLPLELPAFVLGPATRGGDADDESVRYVRGRGPLATSLADLPATACSGVVLANELLDNLPFDLLEYDGSTWQEVLVGAAGDGDVDELVEVLVPAPPDLVAEAERLVRGPGPPAPDLPGPDLPRLARPGPYAPAPGGERARVPLQRAASAWLRQALRVLERGRVIVVDYADTTAGMARRPPADWLRTYRRHLPGGPPLEWPGSQDITSVVAVDQLAAVRRPVSDLSQAAWLEAHGVETLVEEARDVWRASAHLGDLEAMKARSTVHEADALRDREGLGAFRVLEWAVG
jgi:SAM-dependent MidA family methyltransferase